MNPTFECLYCDHQPDSPGDCCLWQQKGEAMTSGHEMSQYEAEQGDMGDDGHTSMTTPDPATVAAAIAKVRELDVRSTPQPWRNVGSPRKYAVAGPKGHGEVARTVEQYMEGSLREANAETIAEYRSLAPLLADACESLQQALAAAEAKRAEAERERDHLAKFKAYVHKRLDDADVPEHPPGPHGAEGCRIGDRLDWVQADRKALADQIGLLTRKVITCGVAASHPDAKLTRMKKCYAEDWNSPQAEEVRTLRERCDKAEQQLAAANAKCERMEAALRRAEPYVFQYSVYMAALAAAPSPVKTGACEMCGGDGKVPASHWTHAGLSQPCPICSAAPSQKPDTEPARD